MIQLTIDLLKQLNQQSIEVIGVITEAIPSIISQSPIIALVIGIIGMVLIMAIYNKTIEPKTSTPGTKFSTSMLWLTLWILLATIWVLLGIDTTISTINLFHYHFIMGPFGQGIAIIMCVALVAILVPGAIEIYWNGMSGTRYFFLMLVSILGLILMVASTDLISLFLALEITGLSGYLLATGLSDERSSEAGFKYFITGVLSSCFYLLGAAIVYATVGSVSYLDIGVYMSNVTGTYKLILEFGLTMILITLLFKIGSFPFHAWLPDVYEGSPLSVTMFFAIIPKIAAVAVLSKLFLNHFSSMWDLTYLLLYLVIAGGLIMTPYFALRQSVLIRLIAFSAINHIAFILLGLASGSIVGIQIVLLYIVIYMISMIGLFTILIQLRSFGDYISVRYIDDLAGLFDSHKFLSISLAIILFSLAGIPPVAGFFTKLYVLGVAINTKLYVLSIIGVLSSVLSAVYYLYVIKVMFFDKALYVSRIKMSFISKLLILLSISIILSFFIIPNPYYEFIYHMTLRLV